VTKRRLPLAAAIFLVFALAPSALGAPVITPTISGTLGSNGWYTSNVTVSWSVTDPDVLITGTSGCDVSTLTADTGGTSRTCSAENSSGVSLSATVTIKIDKTPPQATGASPERGPDRNGWYNHAVSISFGGGDAMSGIDSCSSVTYSGPDGGGASTSGACRDRAGNTSGSLAFGLQYDATPPTVTGASADRPGHGGWYTRAVNFTFAGTDGASGVEACATVSYSGPDTTSGSVSGTCQDFAGNTSAPAAHAFKYDATAPALTRATVEADSKVATLSWKRAPGAKSYAVVRSPGLKGAKQTTVYRGTKTHFVDRRVKTGVKYRYRVIGYDAAGNAAVAALVARPRPPLHLPKAGAHVKSPPLLAWEAVEKATFYNLQLFQGSEKVLSVWPARNRFRLRDKWAFDGQLHALTPGRYRWYIWPGFGDKHKARFKARLGGSSFVVG
jgi:hypothetical protein